MQQAAGQNADLAPAAQPLAQVDAEPANPLQTNPDIVPATPAPAASTENSIAGDGNPLVEATTTGVQNALEGNTAGAAPQQPANPLNSNTSPSVVGANLESGSISTSQGLLTWTIEEGF